MSEAERVFSRRAGADAMAITSPGGGRIDWQIREGDSVDAGAPLAVVELDGQRLDIAAPIRGTIIELTSAAEVAPGTVIGKIQPAPAAKS